MNRWLVALCFVMSACAPLHSYESDCFKFDSLVELRQDRVDIYVATAKSIFDSKFGEGSLCESAKGTHILVRDDDWWICNGSVECVGYTGPFSQLELSRWGNAFLHEMIHVYEARHFVLGTIDHKDWDELGYNEMHIEFLKVISRNELWWNE